MKLNKDDVILFLPAWYPNRNDKMLGTFVQNHAKALRALQPVHVLYVSAEKKMKRLFEFVDYGNNEYLIYYRKPIKKNILSIVYEGFLYGIAVFWGYHKYRKLHQSPRIFHAHVLTRSALLPYILSHFFKINYFVTEHWSRYLKQSDTFKGVFRKWITRKIVARSNGISTVSLAMKNALIDHRITSSNFPLISNVVGDEFFKVKVSQSNNVFNFIHVSSFDEKSKNINGILNACKLLENSNVSYKLALVGSGSGSGFEQIKKRIIDLGLSNVSLKGELVGDELLNEFQSANAMILFSNYESQSCVILEAQACGMPVIATDVGGIPELIDDNSGILVTVRDEEALATAMIKMIRGAITFDNEKIKAYAKSRYCNSVVAKQFLDFYQSAV